MRKDLCHNLSKSGRSWIRPGSIINRLEKYRRQSTIAAKNEKRRWPSIMCWLKSSFLTNSKTSKTIFWKITYISKTPDQPISLICLQWRATIQKTKKTSALINKLKNAWSKGSTTLTNIKWGRPKEKSRTREELELKWPSALSSLLPIRLNDPSAILIKVDQSTDTKSQCREWKLE